MSALDPIELRLLTGALRAACEEMGVVLIRSAHSANIKERRDASTALFNADGEMVMQAEHIRVHLGSMPAAVSAVLARADAPGVPAVLSDPFAGRTHTPAVPVTPPRLRAATAPEGCGPRPTRCWITPSAARGHASPRCPTVYAARWTCSRPPMAISSCACGRLSGASA